MLYASHARFDFWTWGDDGCCLPRGATSATLLGDHPQLKAGDVLVLAEVAGPRTGNAADADPAKRAAVRLTSVVPSSDPSGGLFADPPTNAAVDVTEIEWDEADALPFPLCISVEEHPGLVVGEAWGNIVLADHGRTIAGESLGEVPPPVLQLAAARRLRPVRAPGSGADPDPLPADARERAGHAVAAVAGAASRKSPDAGFGRRSGFAHLQPTPARLPRGARLLVPRGACRRARRRRAWSVSDGVTVAVLRSDGATLFVYARPDSAKATVAADPRAAGPAVELEGTLLADTEPWLPEPDLLASDADAARFVVEVENDGSATLRFGDDVHGRRPETDTSFVATYRVGNGVAGNVGAGSIAHVATLNGAIAGATNPLPAGGGVDPEPADAVRRDAPEAYLVQERAVTADDYARMSERDPHVQRAAATFRWTGSWHTVFVTADRVGGAAVDDPFETELRDYLEPFRMAGYDLEVDSPSFVPLDVELFLCVQPDYFRSDVKAAVLDVLSSGARQDGTLGFFHPDRFTFGSPVYLSAIVAAAQAVEGVESVTPVAFQRQRDSASSALDTGVLDDGPARDRAPRRRPVVPRARRARADRGRREMSACSCGCCAGVTRAHAARRAEPPGPVRDLVPRRHVRGLPRVARRGADGRGPAAAREARDPRRRRLHDRAARRVGGRVRRAHLLQRAPRAGGVPPHRARAHLAAGARAADRLPAPAGRRRADVARVRARAAARRPGDGVARPRLRAAGDARVGDARAGPARAEHSRPRRAAADVRDRRGGRGAPRVERDARVDDGDVRPGDGRHARVPRRARG